MTLQELNKILDKYELELGIIDSSRFELLKGLPFYNWDNPEDTNTFNHFIGLPLKDGIAYPLFDYEQLVFNALEQHKHLWIKKATGLGITELMLRYMVWLCLKDDRLKGQQMTVVTGPRIELAITIIDRMKALFQDRLLVTFDS